MWCLHPGDLEVCALTNNFWQDTPKPVKYHGTLASINCNKVYNHRTPMSDPCTGLHGSRRSSRAYHCIVRSAGRWHRHQTSLHTSSLYSAPLSRLLLAGLPPCCVVTPGVLMIESGTACTALLTAQRRTHYCYCYVNLLLTALASKPWPVRGKAAGRYSSNLLRAISVKAAKYMVNPALSASIRGQHSWVTGV